MPDKLKIALDALPLDARICALKQLCVLADEVARLKALNLPIPTMLYAYGDNAELNKI